MREEKLYLILRRIFFWVFTLLFLVLTPIILFYSFGYKFDNNAKKFLKTGVITIRTIPKGSIIYLNGQKLNDLTPCNLRELFPGTYDLLLEKEGYYPYKVTIEVKPRMVSQLEAILVRKIKNVEKIVNNFDIYNMFVYQYLLGIKILAFTNKGIYFFNDDFTSYKEISPYIFDKDIAKNIKGIKDFDHRLVFWDENNIWLINLEKTTNNANNKVINIYKAQESIKDIFSGLRDRYLIIQDGLKVIALDIKKYKIFFNVHVLNSVNSKIYYDSRNEALYIRDRLLPTNNFSLFKMNFMANNHDKNES